MPQTSVCTSVPGYYLKVGGVDVQVRDYFPKFADCEYQSTHFMNTTGTDVLKGTIKFAGNETYTADSWLVDSYLPYYEKISGVDTHLKWVVRGYKPQFNLILRRTDPSPGQEYFYKITRTDFVLTLSDQHLNTFSYAPTYFKDGAIPKRLIVCLQGGGGGGGGSDGLVSGNGGGAGGFVSVILDLTKTGGNFYVSVGGGGQGGIAATDGQAGVDSAIYWGNESTKVAIVAAQKGGGGSRGTGVAGYGGNMSFIAQYKTDGYFYLADSLHMTPGSAGGRNGNDGDDHYAATFCATNNTADRSGINILELDAHLGGSKAGTTGGGGGASANGDGGDGGASTEDPYGKDGTAGSGGGGGLFKLLTWSPGGGGGNGFFSIYY